MVEILVPVSLFFSIALVLLMALYFRHRARVEAQTSLRQAIDRGQELTPELIKLMGDPPRHPKADLRRGIIALAIGVGFAVFGLLLGEEDAIQPLLGVASFPCVIGLAYIIMWLTMGEKE